MPSASRDNIKLSSASELTKALSARSEAGRERVFPIYRHIIKLCRSRLCSKKRLLIANELTGARGCAPQLNSVFHYRNASIILFPLSNMAFRCLSYHS